MISGRFAPAICALVALALVPAVIHSYVGATADDGRATTRIATELAGFSSTPSPRNREWGRKRFESDDWIERTYSHTGQDLRLTVVRSYDPKALYHHPELAVAYGTSFFGVETRRFEMRREIPVFVLRPASESRAVGVYALHYGGGFVESPILFQFRTAGELLFSPRKPMTLFFVTGNVPAPKDAESGDAVKLLLAAIDSFLSGGPRSATRTP